MTPTEHATHFMRTYRLTAAQYDYHTQLMAQAVVLWPDGLRAYVDAQYLAGDGSDDVVIAAVAKWVKQEGKRC